MPEQYKPLETAWYGFEPLKDITAFELFCVIKVFSEVPCHSPVKYPVEAMSKSVFSRHFQKEPT